MQGLTRKGLADDLAGSYGDWGDEIMLDGEKIPGFVEKTEEYDETSKKSSPSKTTYMLHTSRDILVKTTVAVNRANFTVQTREEIDGEFTYRITRER